MRPESCLEEHGIIVQHSGGQERCWERASSNVTEAANQVMNIDNATRTYTKGTGGGGSPLLVAHARAVDTRRSFFSPPPPRPSEHLDTRLRQLSLWQWELQLHEHSNNCPFEKCYKVKLLSRTRVSLVRVALKRR